MGQPFCSVKKESTGRFRVTRNGETGYVYIDQTGDIRVARMSKSLITAFPDPAERSEICKTVLQCDRIYREIEMNSDKGLL